MIQYCRRNKFRGGYIIPHKGWLAFTDVYWSYILAFSDSLFIKTSQHFGHKGGERLCWFLWQNRVFQQQKKLPPVGLHLMQEIIIIIIIIIYYYYYYYYYLNFYSCTTWFLDLDYLVRINRAWLYNDLKVLDLQANVSLAQLVRHWALQPVIIPCTRSNPTGGNFFFAVVESFEYNNAISANFV